jgi:hypothetical protein
MNGELERMWKEAIMAYFKELSQYFPGGLKKITKILKQAPPKYKSEVLLCRI